MNMVVYITELKEKDFDDFTKEGLALVDVWAPWCVSCKQISPIVDQLSIDFIGRVSVGKLNADECYETITKLGIRSIPTLLLYRNGEIIDKSIGMTTKQKLTDLLNKYL